MIPAYILHNEADYLKTDDMPDTGCIFQRQETSNMSV